jgi:hypothetical protein
MGPPFRVSFLMYHLYCFILHPVYLFPLLLVDYKAAGGGAEFCVSCLKQSAVTICPDVEQNIKN